MSPTCSKRDLAGRNALPAIPRTIYGHPEEILTRHQSVSAPTGPHLGRTATPPQPGSPRSSFDTDSHRCVEGFGCRLSPFELAEEVVPDRLELIECGDAGNRVLSSDAFCRS